MQAEADLRMQLQKIGFQTTALNLEKLDCHILLLDTQALTESLSLTFEKALKQNPDLKVILIGKSHQYSTLCEYKKFNAEVVLDYQDLFLTQKTVWEIEKACFQLYLFYQNEQLLKDYLDVQKQLEKSLHLASTMAMVPAQAAAPSSENLDVLSGLYKCEDFESALSFFLNQAPHEKRLFFRFFSSEMKFKVTAASGFDLLEIKNMEYQTNQSDLRNLIGLQFSVLPAELEEVLVRGFKYPHFLLFPLVFMNTLIGFYVFKTSSVEEDFRKEKEYLDHVGRAALVQLEMFWLRGRVNDSEVRDPQTQLYNVIHYQAKLREEFHRAERMQHPLSLLRFSLDNYKQLKQQFEPAIFDEKLTIFAQAIVQTGRPHDISCRVGENEIALLLPYCSRKNAAIRAERLKKAISSHSDLRGVFEPTLSFGVSEYPSLCGKFDELDSTAAKTMKHIQERGGNKVGIYRAPQDHSPAFSIDAE